MCVCVCVLIRSCVLQCVQMSGKGRLFTGASSELLPGEIAVARATNAQQLPYTTEVGQPVSGCLTCTNYRIAFAAVSEVSTRAGN